METRASRRVSLTNWVILACNMCLLIALIMPRFVLSDPDMARARKDADLCDMAVYFAKGPFAILVDKDFPEKDAFSFADDSLRLSASARAIERDDDSNATRTAMLVIGSDVSLSCDYWIVGAEAHVESIMLSTHNKGVWDLNVDGVFDQQIVTDAESGTGYEQIWYDGQWQDVVPHGTMPRYERQLPHVGRVTFDKMSGRWTRAANDKQNGTN